MEKANFAYINKDQRESKHIFKSIIFWVRSGSCGAFGVNLLSI